MDHVRRPEQAHRMAQAVVPVVTEVVGNEGEYPRPPVFLGQVEEGRVVKRPLIRVQAEETEEHAHSGGDDATAQAVDCVCETVVIRSPPNVDEYLDGDQGEEHGDRKRD